MITLPYRIERWDQIPGAIAHMQAAGAHHRAVLMQALYRGHIAHYEIQRTTPADRAPTRGVAPTLLSRVGCSIRLPGAAG